jgi:predicted peptidase
MSLLIVLGCAGVATDPTGVAEQKSEPRLIRQSYVSPNEGEREYFVHLPRGYDSEAGRRWPVMLFLHGNGERGNGRDDLDWVLVHGPLYEVWIQKRDLPFIIVAPQLPLYGMEKTVDYIANRKLEDIPQRLASGVPPRPEEFETPWEMAAVAVPEELPIGPEGPPEGWPRLEEDLLIILDQVQSLYRTDAARVYLTGICYGGFGTWYLASRHPERFAAIAPVVGWGHPDLMPSLAERRMPVWVFAGGRDPAVWPQLFYPGINSLEELQNREGDVRFTIHVDAGHDAWRRVYAGGDLYNWLLQHSLPAK